MHFRGNAMIHPPYRVVIATGNAHKINEIQSIIGDIGVEWVPGTAIAVGPVEESGKTYEENAVIKAMAYSQDSGLPALADDSGLEVDALGGLPGLRSNRFFGPGLTDTRKIELLLRRLSDVPEPQRTARFVCHAVLVDKNHVLVSVRGTVEGVIARQPSGGSGFGYDPVFRVPALNATFAEISETDKSRISHRGQAMRRIRDFLLQNAE